MPLLKLETDIFPTDLFALGEDDFPWRVAHVRSRQEKALARHLHGAGVPFYLPQREHKVARSGRTFRSYLPLFPGYLFFRGAAAECQRTLRSNVVVRLLDVPAQGVLSSELGQIYSLLRLGASLTVQDTFAPGDAVRVVRGPFQGYSGIVVRASGRPRLIVSISMLRKSVVVEFDREAVSRIAPRMAGSLRSAVA